MTDRMRFERHEVDRSALVLPTAFQFLVSSTKFLAPGTRCFGTRLIPDHLRRYSARPVSYYALFKWWLLLSQHPGCHRRITSYRTKLDFGTLAGDLGCFPLDREDYPSRTHSRDKPMGIRSLIGACRRVAPRLLSVALPLMGIWLQAAPKGISKRTR